MEWFIIIACAVVAAVSFFFIGKHFASKPIEDNNKQIEAKKLELEKEIELLSKHLENLTTVQYNELDKINAQIKEATQRNNWIEQQYKERLEVISNTQQLADKEYEERINNLNIKYNTQYAQYQKEIQTYQDKIEDAKGELESLQATKAAAIEAARKEQNIQKNKEEYCLTLPREEERDIPLLREVQYKISKPRAIAMCIWSNYYQIVAKTKFPKILGKQDVTGIYKITNQKTGECYIGQAVDVRKRWADHCKAGLGVDTPQGNKLYAAMQEFGLEQFSFELLEECKGNELDNKEKYFIELYQSNIYGYNGNAGNNG